MVEQRTELQQLRQMNGSTSGVQTPPSRTSSNCRKIWAERVMKENELPVEAFESWTDRWYSRRGDTDNTEYWTEAKDAKNLVHLLAHYPQIVYLGFSFWRKMLLSRDFVRRGLDLDGRKMNESISPYGDPDVQYLHPILPNIFFRRRIPVSSETLKKANAKHDAMSSFRQFLSTQLRNRDLDLALLVFENFNVSLSVAPTTTLLQDVVAAQSIPLAKRLLVGPDGKCKVSGLGMKDLYSTDTSMHAAARRVDSAMLEYLITLGAAVNTPAGEDGTTPLLTLVKDATDRVYRWDDSNDVQTAAAVRILIQGGADVESTDSLGLCALQYLVSDEKANLFPSKLPMTLRAVIDAAASANALDMRFIDVETTSPRRRW